jgi:LmbE family N-acetylglucosaminyl deacetylase
VVFSANEIRKAEARASAKMFLQNAGKSEVIIKNFKESFFPYIGAEIKKFFEAEIKKADPDLIFSHYRHDLHQDHRLISELTWNTFRHHTIFEYEIIKFDGDMSTPNFFVHLSKKESEEKIDCLFDSFRSQHGRDWFTRDTFTSILRIRGIESRASSGMAEGFFCRKAVL